MTAQRRLAHSFALDHAVDLAREAGKPLLVLEALRIGYPHASVRLHRFVLEGMAANEREARAAGVRYLAYVEPEAGHGSGLLARLAKDAVAVVADDRPGLFFPAMLEAAGRALDVRLVAVDGCGLLPLSRLERAWPTAFAFRRHLQRVLPGHLGERPVGAPLRARSLPGGSAPVPREVLRRWPMLGGADLADPDRVIAPLAIDRAVPAVSIRGGAAQGQARLRAFAERGLARYAEGRNHPDDEATSGLSPWLHFGHVGAHQVFGAVTAAEGWERPASFPKAAGRSEGWWGMGASAEAFLDQAVTWRELGFAAALHLSGHDGFDAVPAWAKRTLGKHAKDPRERVYDLATFEAAAAHDEVWNAAQRQLLVEGRIHNAMRMLWGKKILQWSRSPEEALETMVHLNDRWAVDGRDPNSYSGILWVLGRYDRPWGPERPVFGTVRFMSSASARRKWRLRAWLSRHGASGEAEPVEWRPPPRGRRTRRSAP
jgi:deoxyribodipyrimidine photo-lyase